MDSKHVKVDKNQLAENDLPAIYDDLLSHDLSQTGGHVTRRASTQR